MEAPVFGYGCRGVGFSMQISAIALSLWNPAWVGFVRASNLSIARPPSARIGRSCSDETVESREAIRLFAPGIHDVSLRAGEEVLIDDTGVSVRVEDLKLGESERTVYDGTSRYLLPALVPRGHVIVEGSSGNDVIKVRQEDSGDTVVDVTHGGMVNSLNLGRVAALTLQAGGGKDTLEVDVRDYFGGITVDGGDGNDSIRMNVARSLRRGVTIRGNAGADTIALSGSAFRLLADGGSGNDAIDALRLGVDGTLSRRMQGGEGDDVVIGSAGDDTIRGDAGDDRLLGGRGNDRIQGGAGNDTLAGGTGADRLEGEEGDDLLMGDGGDDVLDGGAGVDLLYGGSGIDMFRGGDGVNSFAPGAESPNEIMGYGRVGSCLSVTVRGEPRSQPVLTACPFVNKTLFDYRPGIDSLLDRSFVV